MGEEAPGAALAVVREGAEELGGFPAGALALGGRYCPAGMDARTAVCRGAGVAPGCRCDAVRWGMWGRRCASGPACSALVDAPFGMGGASSVSGLLRTGAANVALFPTCKATAVAAAGRSISRRCIAVNSAPSAEPQSLCPP